MISFRYFDFRWFWQRFLPSWSLFLRERLFYHLNTCIRMAIIIWWNLIGWMILKILIRALNLVYIRTPTRQMCESSGHLQLIWSTGAWNACYLQTQKPCTSSMKMISRGLCILWLTMPTTSIISLGLREPHIKKSMYKLENVWYCSNVYKELWLFCSMMYINWE